MAIIDDLQKVWKNALFRGDEEFWHTDFLRTGIPTIDYALGGGFGYGRVAELLGMWSSGKTMILYKALAANQAAGGISILFEAEGAFDETFYRLMGGDPSTLWVYPLDTVEQFMDCLYTICESKKKAKDLKPFAVGWDSIAATGTKHLMETDMEDAKDMSKANAMSMGASRIRTVVKEARVAVISTNQIREKIGDMGTGPHTPGGNAWPFLASQRIHLKSEGGEKSSRISTADGKHEIGRWVIGEVIKNKLAATLWYKFSLPIYLQSGHAHPEYGHQTTLGIDVYESLFYGYLRQRILSPDKKDIIIMPTNGWYQVNPELVPNDRKFRKGEWPKIVSEFPFLWTFPYTREIPKSNAVVQPTPASAPAEQPAATGASGEPNPQ